MKKFRKLFAVLTASALVGAMSFTTMAATINKNESFIGSGSASIKVNLPGSTATNTYKVYRVFDATSDGENTHISYKLNANHAADKTVPAGFTVDAVGNVRYHDPDATALTDADIKAIKGYVTEADLVATVTTEAGENFFELKNLPYGYYYISTTTGTLVTVDSTNPNVTVQDKNEVPTLDKSITGVISGIGDVDNDGKKALAQVGTTLSYSATIKVGTGAENYVFHDNMSGGLKLVEGSVVIKDNDDKIKATDYTLETAPNSTTDTIKITFVDEYISKLAKDSVITITYNATVTSDALTFQSVDGKNTATLDYGHSSETNSTPIKSTEVHNAKLTVTKNQPDPNDKENTIPLAGAGFVIKNEAGKYYKYTVDKTTNKASVTWADDIGDATEHVSGDDGSVPAFTGLANGTYTLVEKTTPAGYNTAPDQPFTITDGDYTADNLEQTATVTNVKGLELPSTGGMGTVAFAVVGLIVMAGAAVTLIIKKRA